MGLRKQAAEDLAQLLDINENEIESKTEEESKEECAKESYIDNEGTLTFENGAINNIIKVHNIIVFLILTIVSTKLQLYVGFLNS